MWGLAEMKWGSWGLDRCVFLGGVWTRESGVGRFEGFGLMSLCTW